MLWRLKCFHFNYLRVSARGKGKFLRVESPIPYPRTAECPHTCPPWSSTTWRTRPWRLSRSSCCSGGKQSDSPNLKESEDRIFQLSQVKSNECQYFMHKQLSFIIQRIFTKWGLFCYKRRFIILELLDNNQRDAELSNFVLPMCARPLFKVWSTEPVFKSNIL